ncbi:MAG TPA: hypothetical protein VGR26_19515 [Acidimicrobiales bacterium]|nr:hypothetical protein [Acidimicrobiales bacterium]
MSLQTEFEFTLPKGYVDKQGELHRTGTMRLATARDEIEPLRDLRVADNEAYLTVIMLARVVTRLGTMTEVTPNVIEGLFAADLAYLQEFYGIVNFGDPAMLEELDASLPSSAPADSGRRTQSGQSSSRRTASNGKARARATA